MSYVMYPDVFVKFAKAAPPTATSAGTFAGVLLRHAEGPGDGGRSRAGQDAGGEIPRRRRAASGRHPDRLFRVEWPASRGHIRDRKLKVETRANPKADPFAGGHVGAPIPGAVTSIAVELNQEVKKGDKLL